MALAGERALRWLPHLRRLHPQRVLGAVSCTLLLPVRATTCSAWGRGAGRVLHVKREECGLALPSRNLPRPCREKNIKTFDLYVGLINLLRANNHTQWFEVNRVILHPTYQLNHPVGADVALVQLKSRIEFSDFVLPVCLPPVGLNLSRLSCWATGWGLISQQGQSNPEVPRQVTGSLARR